MEQRVRMLADHDTGNWSVTELCARYRVCRDTFYEWRKRRASGEEDWFVDHSHAPSHCPHRTDPELVERLLKARRRFPHLGPRKLVVLLRRDAPEVAWPAASTIGDILKKAGLIEPAVIWPNIISLLRSSSLKCSQVAQCGTRLEFAISTRGAS